MTSPNFGWFYPPGAEHDPDAPYNQGAELFECPECGNPVEEEDELCGECARDAAGLERWERDREDRW